MRYSYEAFLAELGAKLRKMRVDRGWTLRHMIVTHGFHLAHWQGFEKGKGISVPSLLRVCEVFDIAMEDLIAGLGIIDLEGAKPEAPTVARKSSKLQSGAISSETPDERDVRPPRRRRS